MPPQSQFGIRYFGRVVITATLLLLLAWPLAAVEPVNKTLFGGVAIEGYDPVAYFQDGAPRKGAKKHVYDWRGATWRFASTANRQLFVADPEKYAPQYGGYCAFAVSQGKTAGIDPDSWSIVDDKLYLNYNQKIQTKWRADIPGYISSADAAWPRLLAE